MVALYSLTLLLSASILFCIEPMVAKMLLPIAGGVPAVWDTCLVFFQVTLLAGYAFAHVSLKKLGARRQAFVQVALVAVALVALPIAIRPATAARFAWLGPAWQALAVLVVAAGAPFFVLSTMAPTLQRWFSVTGSRHARDPYFLYAASNVGSIGALAAYPTLIESHAGLAEQARGMRVAYVALLLCVVGCAIAMRRSAGREDEEEEEEEEEKDEQGLETGTGNGNGEKGRRVEAAAGTAGTAAAGAAARAAARTARRWRIARWVLLGAVPSAQLVAVTTYITTEIAPAPLLWVVPLAAYLLSFVVVFAPRRIVSHERVGQVLPFAIALVVYMIAIGGDHPPLLVLPLHLGVFFVAATYCHGELAADRPPPARLAEFYLWMATGGAIGGAAIALGAPALLAQPIEYPATLLFVLACRSGDKAAGAAGAARSRWVRTGLVVVIAAAVAFVCRRFDVSPVAARLLPGVPLLIAFTLESTPQPFVFAMGAVLVFGALSQDRGSVDLAHERSFFGALTVTRDAELGTTTLMHGNTIHGVQLASAPHMPTTYYAENGPAGDVFRMTEYDALAAGAPRHVAIVGLGTGTLATYARPGEKWRFFEIDPAVVKVARDRRYFTYLSDAFPAGVDVLVGDARLELAKDAGGYDLLVVDAFSSDAIPVHLLTREAFALDRTKLAAGAVVLWHISNRYLDLEPVIGELMHDAGWAALLRDDGDISDADSKRQKIGSEWVATSAQPARLDGLRALKTWRELQRRAGFAVWTDDRAAILSVLR